MPRSKSLAELERERGRLVERSATQRDTLAVQLVPVARVLQFGERVAQTLPNVRVAYWNERWRRDQRLQLTARLRPELIEAARAAAKLTVQDEATLKTQKPL